MYAARSGLLGGQLNSVSIICPQRASGTGTGDRRAHSRPHGSKKAAMRTRRPYSVVCVKKIRHSRRNDVQIACSDPLVNDGVILDRLLPKVDNDRRISNCALIRCDGGLI